MRRGPFNYLDLIPQRGPGCKWEPSGGHIVVTRPNTGPVNRLAQLLYAAPKQTRFTLDGLGSFVWERLDGALTVEQIAGAVSSRFGESAEPLYPRLTQYLTALRENGFITFLR